MPGPDPRKVRLVELLLRKAARTNFEHEAAAFRAKAEHIMARDGITPDMLPDARARKTTEQYREDIRRRQASQGFRSATHAGPVVIITFGNGSTTTAIGTDFSFTWRFSG